jgi:hypothetical protein
LEPVREGSEANGRDKPSAHNMSCQRTRAAGLLMTDGLSIEPEGCFFVQVPRGVLPEIPTPGPGAGVDKRLTPIILEVSKETTASCLRVPDHVRILFDVDP